MLTCHVAYEDEYDSIQLKLYGDSRSPVACYFGYMQCALILCHVQISVVCSCMLLVVTICVPLIYHGMDLDEDEDASLLVSTAVYYFETISD
jgi:hypothetical protein